MRGDLSQPQLGLTDAQWQIADAIARQLVLDGTDVNELRKATSYLREHLDRENAGKKFFDYLKTLVRNGNGIGHSKRTIDYYQSLDTTCNQYLESYQDDAPKMLVVLSWAARLVQYYDKGVPTGEIEKPSITSQREAEIQSITQSNNFEVGQTYQLLDIIRLTIKEPKRSKIFTRGQLVNVEITQIKEDGTLKKIKATD